MNHGKYIFTQFADFHLVEPLCWIGEKYSENKRVRNFTHWNQMPCMIVGRLTAQDSMQDLILNIETHSAKYYHLGLGATITHTNKYRKGKPESRL